jgi:mannose-6-phosphate isomerase-like protein (cupin superfamily)
MARVPLDMENAGMSYLRVAPNFRIPFGHNHKQQEEVYVVVAGGGRIALKDEVRDLQLWDAVRVHKDTMRGLEGGPEGMVLIAIGAPNTGPGDADMTQGWWAH